MTFRKVPYHTFQNPKARSNIEEKLLSIIKNTNVHNRTIVFGGPNMGKSSFVCTVDSAVRGQRSEPARVRTVGEDHLFSLRLDDYPITERVSIVDIWGWDFKADNLKSDLFRQIIDGMVPFRQFKENLQVRDCDISRVCHAVLFVLTMHECFTPGYLEKIKIFYDIAIEMGRIVSFAISKLDLNTNDSHIVAFNNEVNPEKAELCLLNSQTFIDCTERIQLIVGNSAICYPLVNYQYHQNRQLINLDHLVGRVMEGILTHIENDCLLTNEREVDQVFDPFQYETPITLQNYNGNGYIK